MPLAPELLVRRLPTVMQFIAYPGLLIYADPSEFLDRLAALEGVIPQLRAMQVRRTLTPGTGFDAALVADFDSLEDVAAYKNDPRHLAVSALCKAIRTERCAIDIEA